MVGSARIALVGDTTLLVEFGAVIDVEINRKVVALAEELRAARIAGVSDIVPTFRSLLLHFDPDISAPEFIENKVAECLGRYQGSVQASRRWTVPVCYDESLAPDLAWVAGEAGLSQADVAERHAAADYRVYMLGFLPCQAYLGEVDRALRFPRLQSPRARIAAGSVGVAEAMTSVFPMETPCGWRILGRSPLALLDTSAAEFMRAGDAVAFLPVSLAEFNRWRGADLSRFNDMSELRA